MKILFTIEFYHPHIGGAEEVVKQLAEGLTERGHTAVVATSFLPERKGIALNGVRIEEFKISGNAVRGVKGRARELERYEQLLTGDFDIVLNYAAQSWTTDLAFPILEKMQAKRVLVPCGYSGLHQSKYINYFQELPDALRKYDALVYMSPNYQDKIFGDAHGVGAKAVLIPNGASKKEFFSPDHYKVREKLSIRTPHLAVCVANHYLAKGHRFVWKAFRRMGRKDTSLLFVASEEKPHTFKGWGHWFLDYWQCRVRSWFHPSVYVVDGRDREAVLSAYKSADLFLFGSGVECSPLVMYESFAAAVPFLTTPVGNVADHKEALCIARTPEEMARAANDLLDHPAARERLVDQGRRVWQNGHQWETLVGEYERLFTKIIDNSR